jgi:hypothetical protein
MQNAESARIIKYINLARQAGLTPQMIKPVD